MARRGGSLWRAARVTVATSVLAGMAVAVLATQASSVHLVASVSAHTMALPPPTSAGSFSWPTTGEASVGVPALDVQSFSPREGTVPIASLTKMMTVLVALEYLPLSVGESGPCHVVTAADVSDWEHDNVTGQSNVKVVQGDQLCEDQLLEGIFVHSAGNYARLLVKMTGLTMAQFVSQMNATASIMGLTHTHYVDVSGISPGSRSDAVDQLQVVEAVMGNAAVRQIAKMGSATLPGAGLVTTYTPLLGEAGVVGVKSGFTNPAGGCDALALKSTVHGVTFDTYAVDLGQMTGDVINQAGQIADDLAHTAVGRVDVRASSSGPVTLTATWGSSGAVTLATDAADPAFWTNDASVGLAAAQFAWSRAPSPGPQLSAGLGAVADRFTVLPPPVGTVQVVGAVVFRGTDTVYDVLRSPPGTSLRLIGPGAL